MYGGVTGKAGDSLPMSIDSILSCCNHVHTDIAMKLGKWIKRLGFWGFLFFFVKGLLWLLIPALIAWWSTS
jgi:hypothetical protein